MATLCQFDITAMTAQEVFDEASKHLLTQNKKSWYDSDGSCAYNGPNGTCCAAAPFLKGYEPDMECKGYIVLVEMFNQPEDHKLLMCGLQKIHDHTPVEHWYCNLIRLGKSLNLQIKEEIFGKEGT